MSKSFFALVVSLIFFGTLLSAPKAQAYPENIRDGYVNCTACHVSPSGGGTLTAYGRSLSAELMSTWSYKNEEGFLHGAIKENQMPEWLTMGGDLRAVQTYEDNSQFTQKRFLNMQEDIEAAVRNGLVTVDSTFGYINDGQGNYHWGSRRYFAMANLSDEVTIRAGRFYPAFGIYLPDHYVTTRMGLGFDENQEGNSLEAAWNGENWSAFLTESQSPGEIDSAQRETATAVQLNRNIGDSSKVGVNGWYGKSDKMKREILGAHGMIGFTKTIYLLSELDHQWNDPSGQAEQRGIYMFNRLGYEFHRGLIAFVQGEYQQPDFQNGGSAQDAYGPGIQFFPRPHFEFMGLWRKTRIRSQGSAFNDYGLLLLHYYF